FGDEQPLTAPPGARVDRGLLRVDPRDWSCHPVAGPSFARPIDVGVTADARALLVVDFGHFEMPGEGRVDARPGSGRLWKIMLD
ncbi:MAG: hypothetical protein ABSG76_15120, partial [Xanthobacteraceae bacterium]